MTRLLTSLLRSRFAGPRALRRPARRNGGPHGARARLPCSTRPGPRGAPGPSGPKSRWRRRAGVP